MDYESQKSIDRVLEHRWTLWFTAVGVTLTLNSFCILFLWWLCGMESWTGLEMSFPVAFFLSFISTPIQSPRQMFKEFDR